MGIFDSFKNVFGGKAEAEKDVTVSPNQMLRAAGIDPSELNFGFGSDGSITVSGQISQESDRQAILDTLAGAAGINRVEDQMTVAFPDPAPAETPAAETEAADPAVEPEAVPASEGAKTYTVQSGDTLWKISEEVYGNGSKYMKIFEANTGLLEHPDRIFPGQKLNIPELDD